MLCVPVIDPDSVQSGTMNIMAVLQLINKGGEETDGVFSDTDMHLALAVRAPPFHSPCSITP